MTTGLLKLTGNTLYFIGALMVVLPLIALVVTGGMVLLAGYTFLLTPVAGVVVAGVGKRMIKNAQRIGEENKADKEEIDRIMCDIKNDNDLTT